MTSKSSSFRTAVFFNLFIMTALVLPAMCICAGCGKPKPPPKPVDRAYKAVCEGNLKETRKILDKRNYRNLELQDGSTLFHIAVMHGHKDIAEYLLPNVTNINLAGPGAMTPLHLAASKGHLELVRFLLDRGADVDSGKLENKTPLLMAASIGRTDIAALLLDRGADIDMRDGGGFTPLHWATINGHKEMVILLLEKGADFSIESKKGRAPLWYASLSPEIEAILAKKREFRRIVIICDPAQDADAPLQAVAAGFERLLMRRLQGFDGVVVYQPLEIHRAWFTGKDAPAKAPEPDRLHLLADSLKADRVAQIRLAPAGEELTVEAFLFNAGTNITESVMSERVRGPAGLASLEEKLASEIVRRLEIATSGTVARISTENPEAFRLFSEGAQLLIDEKSLPSITTNRTQLSEAAGLFAAASRMDPSFLAAPIDAASTLINIQRLDKNTNVMDSVEFFVKTAQNISSNHPCVLLISGMEATLRGKSNDAMRAYDSALALNRHLAEARFQRALLQRSMKLPDEAVNDFLRVLRFCPRNAMTFAEMGLTLAHVGNWENCVKQCEKAIDLDPHIPEVYGTLAVAHWQLKNLKYAEKTVLLARHFGHEDAVDKKFIERLKKDIDDAEDIRPQRR